MHCPLPLGAVALMTGTPHAVVVPPTTEAWVAMKIADAHPLKVGTPAQDPFHQEDTAIEDLGEVLTITIQLEEAIRSNVRVEASNTREEILPGTMIKEEGRLLTP